MTTFLLQNYQTSGRIRFADEDGVQSIAVDGFECADGSKVGDVLRIDEQVTITIGKVSSGLGKRSHGWSDSKQPHKNLNGTDQKPKKGKGSEEIASVGKISAEMSIEVPESIEVPKISSSAGPVKQQKESKPIKPIKKSEEPKLEKPKPSQPDKKLQKQPSIAQNSVTNHGKQSPISKSVTASHLKVENETSESITSEETKPPAKTKQVANKEASKSTAPTVGKSLFGAFAGSFGEAKIDFAGKMDEEPLMPQKLESKKEIPEGTQHESKPEKAKKPKKEVKVSQEPEVKTVPSPAAAETPNKDPEQAPAGKKRGRPKKNVQQTTEQQDSSTTPVVTTQESQVEHKPKPPKADTKKQPVPVQSKAPAVRSSSSSSEESKAPQKPAEAPKPIKVTKQKPAPVVQNSDSSEESSQPVKKQSKSANAQAANPPKKTAENGVKSTLSAGSDASKQLV